MTARKPFKPKNPNPGIKSLKGLRRRCSQADGCWVWTGVVNPRGNPIAMLDGKSGQLVRRWAYREAHKDEPGFVMPALVWSSCGHKQCCNPDHLIPETYRERAQRSNAGVKQPELKRLRISQGRAAAGLTVVKSHEQARAIRADQRPDEVIAAELGMAPKSVQAIRLGLRWKEPKAAGASVFNLGGVAA